MEGPRRLRPNCSRWRSADAKMASSNFGHCSGLKQFRAGSKRAVKGWEGRRGPRLVPEAASSELVVKVPNPASVCYRRHYDETGSGLKSSPRGLGALFSSGPPRSNSLVPLDGLDGGEFVAAANTGDNLRRHGAQKGIRTGGGRETASGSDIRRAEAGD